VTARTESKHTSNNFLAHGPWRSQGQTTGEYRVCDCVALSVAFSMRIQWPFVAGRGATIRVGEGGGVRTRDDPHPMPTASRSVHRLNSLVVPPCSRRCSPKSTHNDPAIAAAFHAC